MNLSQAIAVTSHFMLVIIFVGAGYVKAFTDTDAEAAKLGGSGGFAAKIYVRVALLGL